MDDGTGGFGDQGPPAGPITDPHLGVVDVIIGYIIGDLYILANAINYVYSILKALLNFLVTFFRTLGKFLLHIWQQYVKRAIAWLAIHVQKLRAWLKRTIGPIIKRLEKIKKWYDTHILKQQLRMLQQLQTIRRFLGILRLFHVK